MRKLPAHDKAGAKTAHAARRAPVRGRPVVKNAGAAKRRIVLTGIPCQKKSRYKIVAEWFLRLI
jgi:hypothetical protein